MSVGRSAKRTADKFARTVSFSIPERRIGRVSDPTYKMRNTLMIPNDTPLTIDAKSEVEAISRWLKHTVLRDLRRKGLVVAVSGGIDSAVCAALSVRSLGTENVLALLLPDRDSSTTSRDLGPELAARFGIQTITHDITGILEKAGCYEQQTAALRCLDPFYGEGWKSKVILPPILGNERLNISRVVIQNPDGTSSTHRPTPEIYRQLVAATNYKQRTRTMLSYFHADRLHYAVCGTPNRLEYELGFFVKGGDGLADIKPIAHLYKSQVYQLARELGVPESIIARTPTTDTYSLAQTQEEFFFALPYQSMDLCLYGFNNNIPAGEIGQAIGLTAEQAERVYADVAAKKRNAEYLHKQGLVFKLTP